MASNFLSEYLQNSGFTLQENQEDDAQFIVKKDSLLPEEGYTLSISETLIVLKANDAAGAFYGMQTLRQLLPASLEKMNSFPHPTTTLPLVEIKDFPRPIIHQKSILFFYSL